MKSDVIALFVVFVLLYIIFDIETTSKMEEHNAEIWVSCLE